MFSIDYLCNISQLHLENFSNTIQSNNRMLNKLCILKIDWIQIKENVIIQIATVEKIYWLVKMPWFYGIFRFIFEYGTNEFVGCQYLFGMQKRMVPKWTRGLPGWLEVNRPWCQNFFFFSTVCNRNAKFFSECFSTRVFVLYLNYSIFLIIYDTDSQWYRYN